MRVSLQSGYVLHTRPYRESSLLVEYFGRECGRVSLVARGAKGRKARGGSPAALLQAFVPLLCSWSGRAELKTLTSCEAVRAAYPLTGRRLYSGLYINELLARLLHYEDPHQLLFDRYSQVLEELAGAVAEEALLRRFEFTLLEELGYGFDLDTDGLTGKAIDEKGWYKFDEEYGLVQLDENTDHVPRYLGAELQQIGRDDFSGRGGNCAKRLMRQALAAQLGDKPLKSRELFQRPS